MKGSETCIEQIDKGFLWAKILPKSANLCQMMSDGAKMGQRESPSSYLCTRFRETATIIGTQGVWQFILSLACRKRNEFPKERSGQDAPEHPSAEPLDEFYHSHLRYGRMCGDVGAGKNLVFVVVVILV